MDANSVLQSLIASGPVAVVLFYWVWQERKERRELQSRLLDTLDKQTKLGESVRMALLKATGKEDAE